MNQLIPSHISNNIFVDWYNASFSMSCSILAQSSAYLKYLICSYFEKPRETELHLTLCQKLCLGENQSGKTIGMNFKGGCDIVSTWADMGHSAPICKTGIIVFTQFRKAGMKTYQLAPYPFVTIKTKKAGGHPQNFTSKHLFHILAPSPKENIWRRS